MWPKAQRGQAAVEAALTLPLIVFLIVGTLQLFLMVQARIQARYAVFRAVRVGVVNFADCRAMNDAALAALLPTFARTDDAARTVEAFRRRNAANGYRYFAAHDAGHDREIFWLERTPVFFRGEEDVNFDQWDAAPEPRRLEAQLVYWYALRVPFANWVMSRIFLGYFGLQAMRDQNPLMPAQDVPPDGWLENAELDARVRSEFVRRVDAQQYAFPIIVSHSMRMMSPIRKPFEVRCRREP